MVSDVFAHAQRVDADFAGAARPALAVAAVHDGLVGIAAASLTDGLEQGVGGAAGGIDLVAVVGFADFDIPIVELSGGLLNELQEQVDADAHVRRPEHGHAQGGVAQGGVVWFCQAGRAADEGDAVRGAPIGPLAAAIGEREFDEDVAGLTTIGRDGQAERRLADRLAGIAAELRIVGPTKRGDDGEAGIGRGEAEDGGAGAAGATGDCQTNGCHEIVSRSSVISRTVLLSPAAWATAMPAVSVSAAAARRSARISARALW